jgi:cephalosporin hydroxylase
MNEIEKFRADVAANVAAAGADKDVQALSRVWVREIARYRYAYNFTWLGRPIIQFPQDMIAMQELIWQVRPDLIIETGIAHGGSLIMSASLLALLDYCDAIKAGMFLDPHATRRRVLGIDIDIRSHNLAEIHAHPMSNRIHMIQGSSIDPDVIAQVRELAKVYQRILVCLDANHTQEHVLAELDAYAPLVSLNSYCVVFDTLIELMPQDLSAGRLWGKGNNPLTAVMRFLSRLETEDIVAADGGHLCFEVDSQIDNKLLISAAPRGYLRRVRRSR